MTLKRFLLFTCIVVISCQKSNRPALFLNEINEIVNTTPDKAFLRLMEADSSLTFNREQRAAWNLLVTQAMDMACMEHRTDSLIYEAIAYYEQKKDPVRLMLSYYYMGRVSDELGDALRAQEYYLKALDVDIDATNLLLLGKIESNLASLYTYQDSYEDALLHLKCAANYFEILQDSLFISYNLRDIARVYSVIDSLDFAIEYYEKAIPYAKKESIPSIFSELGGVYTANNNLDKGYEYLWKAMSTAQSEIDFLPIYLTLGRYFVTVNNYDSARYYLNKSIRNPRRSAKASTYYYLAQLAYKNGEWKDYALLSKKFEDLRNLIAKDKNNETMQRMQRLYDYTLIQNEAKTFQLRHTIAKKNNILLTISSLLLLILLALLVVHMRKQRKLWERRIDELLNSCRMREKKREDDLLRMRELEHLVQHTSDKDKKRLITEKEVLENRERTVSLEEIAKKMQDEALQSTSIYKTFHNTPNLGLISFEHRTELFTTIDNIYPGFKRKIGEHIPNIKYHELEICYFLKADILQMDIARLYSSQKSTIGMRLLRLVDKITTSDKKITNEDFRKWLKSL